MTRKMHSDASASSHADRTQLRCGIIGCGTIGRLFYDILADPPTPLGLVVTAVADNAPGAMAPLAGHAATVRDYRQLLELELDAVLIATPPATHVQVARDALAAGKHVLVEKPPARTAAECDELIAASAEHGRVLFFAFHARYNRSVATARTRLAGLEVEKVDVLYREHVRSFHRADSWVHEEGVLWDTGINAVSVLTHLLPTGSVLRVDTVALGRSDEAHGETAACVTFDVGTAGRGRMDLDWRYPGPEVRQMRIEAGRTVLTIDITADALYEDGTLVAGPEAGGLRREYQWMIADFADALRRSISSHSCAEVRFVETVHRMAAPARTERA